MDIWNNLAKLWQNYAQEQIPEIIQNIG